MKFLNQEYNIIKNTTPLFNSSLTEDEKNLIISNAKNLIDKEYKSITMSLYRDFNVTGRRAYYEKLIDERSNDLADLIFAEALDNKGLFIGSIIDLIYLITSETAWWLPAHNLYIRDTEVEDYPDTTKPIICLSSAEKSALLAISILLLKDKLPIQCQKHVIKNIKERTLRPYEEMNFWWMGYNDEHLNNWTPWCIQNILLCYLICEEDEDKIKLGIDKSLFSLEKFFSQYDEDGCCEEGAQYYHHAVLTFMGAIYVLNLLTDDSFSYLYEEEIIKNMLCYIQNINVHDNEYINIGDCDQILDNSDLKPYFFGNLVKAQELCSFIANNWSKNTEANKLLINSKYAFDRILCYSCIDKAKNNVNTVKLKDSFIHYNSTNLFIYNTSPYVLAVNGSNNGVSHNHNDSGSFILYKNNKAIFIDVGVETYNSKTFSCERYSIWTMQDKFHNLTVFKDLPQKTGEKYGVRINYYDSSSICLSMLSAYCEEFNDKYYDRNIKISKELITISDRTNINVPHEFILMCKSKPIKQDFGFSIEDANVYLKNDYFVQEITTNDARLLKSYPTGRLYKITISYDEVINICIS